MVKQIFRNIIEVGYNMAILADFLQEHITIHSLHRTEEENKKVGGVKNSQHIKALAIDFHIQNMANSDVIEAIEFLIKHRKMKEGGLADEGDHIHYDIRGEKARW